MIFCLWGDLALQVKGKVAAVPLRTATKWSFQNWMAFLAMFRLWLSGGTIWYFMLDLVIASLYFSEALLSRIWGMGLSPAAYMRLRTRSRAVIMACLVLFGMDLTAKVINAKCEGDGMPLV